MDIGQSQGGQRDGEDPQRHGTVRMPSRPPEVLLEERLYRLRFRQEQGPRGPVLVSLTVETKHPELLSAAPVFCLDSLLPEANRTSPRTLQQIVQPDGSEATRREAIALLVTALAKNRAQGELVQRPVSGGEPPRPAPQVRDELEPTFEVMAAVTTSFADFVRGLARKSISVFRNDLVVASFTVTTDGTEVESAEIVAEPLNIRWPILDERGDPATAKTANSAILDYVSILRGTRGAMWAVSLHHIAHELERRQRIRLEAKGEIYAEPFLYEFMAAAPDEELWGDDTSRTPVAMALAPNGKNLKPKSLVEGRVTWIGLEASDSRALARQIVLAGYSGTGAEYHLQLSAPPSFDRLMKLLHKQLMVASGWGKFMQVVERVCTVPGIKVVSTAKDSAEHFPVAINSLIEGLQRSSPDVRVTRGAPFERAVPRGSSLSDRIEAYLLGKSLFSAEFVGPTPATTWLIEAALDEDLSGRVSCFNALGGSLYVGLPLDEGRSAKRRETLERLFSAAQSQPHLVPQVLEEIPGALLRSDLMPDARFKRAYAWLDSVAASWQRELLAAGALQSAQAASRIPWWVEPIERDRINLSVLSSHGPDFAWGMSHSVVIGPGGVEGVYVSRGERSFLGLLRGALVTPADGVRYMATEDVSTLLRLTSSSKTLRTQQAIEDTIEDALPHLVVKRGIGMRQSDPLRHDRDLLQRVRNWVGRVFGV